ncbi:PilW family protein [Spartinivicinus poritis]|uniref:PilW family protein n=1 Tax=Spartinivicinus poritis TaxID=2994640 RepID=A0ABT5UBR4_9GAMM|nr:PilW family protein [Spartinivicinus sp. A2-2]MDE1462554.1 PilW family protein [Spartinivicinus sp. A2-2]
MKANRIYKNSGFTIVEMMISLVLGALLLGGIISLFTNNQQTYRIIQGTANLQDNARFAIDVISEDIRMSGYYGCLSNSAAPVYNPSLLNTGSNIDFLFQNLSLGLEAFEATNVTTWQPALPALLTVDLPALNRPPPQGGTDVVAIKRVISNGVTLNSLNDPTKTMQVEGTGSFAQNDAAIISDCEKATLFQVTAANDSGTNQNIEYKTTGATPGNINAPISTGASYVASSSSVYQFASAVYYIAPAWDTTNNQAVTNNRGDQVLSLWRIQGINTAGQPVPEELLRGVENLQVVYGVDSNPAPPNEGDNTIDQYLNANQVDAIANGFERVITARIDLTVNSIDSIGTQNDGVLRRTFSHTVKLRNRGS